MKQTATSVFEDQTGRRAMRQESSVAIRDPSFGGANAPPALLGTTPLVMIISVSAVMGRTRETLSSSVVWPMPFLQCRLHGRPMQQSRSAPRISHAPCQLG
jgi:hypothetical protein